jgi:hypothetical protein
MDGKGPFKIKLKLSQDKEIFSVGLDPNFLGARLNRGFLHGLYR